MENRLSFSKIHITEWLWKINPNTGEPDRRTGHETYRELKAILTETGSRMQAVLHRVGSRAAFLSRLKRIEQDFKTSRKVPLLQIETHGDGDGIGLTDDDGLSWPELMEALTPLNVATGVRLPVVLASCHGIWGIKMAQPMERAPFMALLGPNRRVSPGEVVRGMRAFYRGVFEHNDGNRAMRMLNDIVDPDKVTFGIFNCEKLFTDVWNRYLAEAVSAAARGRGGDRGRGRPLRTPPSWALRRPRLRRTPRRRVCHDRGPVRTCGPCVSRGAQAGGVRPLPPPDACRCQGAAVRPYAVVRRTRRRGDAVRGAAGPAGWGRRRAGTACACCARYSTSWSPASSSSCSWMML